MIKQAAMVVAAVTTLCMGVVASSMAGGPNHNPPPTTTQGHTPVSICHNGRTLTFDDDAWEAHVGHGDPLGPCEPDETETTPDETTTTPTVTTPTVPATPRCPPGMFPTAGKDGAEGNDECEYPKTVSTPSTPVATTPSVTVATTTTPTPTVTPTTPVTGPKQTKPQTKVVVVKKKADKPSKLNDVKEDTRKGSGAKCKKGFAYTKKYGCTFKARGNG